MWWRVRASHVVSSGLSELALSFVQSGFLAYHPVDYSWSYDYVKAGGKFDLRQNFNMSVTFQFECYRHTVGICKKRRYTIII
jgi:hypothetical protein